MNVKKLLKHPQISPQENWRILDLATIEINIRQGTDNNISWN